MKYIINKSVDFIVAERKLSGNDQDVILSNPACRLLLVLLENNQLQVSREELLTKVWEDFGLVSSESSLNNSISSLRRGLSEVGVDNVLETVPKKGFILHLDEVKLENLPGDYLTNNIENVSSANPELTSHYERFLKIFPSVFIAMSVVAILAFLFVFFKEKTLRYQIYDHVNKCTVYFFGDVDRSKVEHYFSTTQGAEILSQCNTPAMIYYDDNNKGQSGGVFESIVSVCKINSDGQVNDCKNYVDIYSG
ncbi:winged helix-turn-helix domain-containing protein [Pseudocitrobacter cyperus]|uniref:Winged helix-turn-helix domain-containing protein n=1 Tax=Pseudocitrobacter cyperus TaxID=3112843 RepID=A0ABV0HPF0_9ENTR